MGEKIFYRRDPLYYEPWSRSEPWKYSTRIFVCKYQGGFFIGSLQPHTIPMKEKSVICPPFSSYYEMDLITDVIRLHATTAPAAFMRE